MPLPGTLVPLVPLFLSALLAVALLLAWVGGSPVRPYMLNADLLYMPAFFDDIFRHGGDRGDWVAPPSGYFFPDHFIAGLAWLVADDFYWQTIIVSVLQILLSFLVFHILGYCLLRDRKAAPAAAILATTLFAWLALNTGSPAPYTGLRSPWLHILTTTFHYGTFLTQTVLLALMFPLLRSGNRRTRLVLVSVVVLLFFLGIYSDPFFLFQFLVPFLAVMAMYHLGSGHRTRAFLAIGSFTIITTFLVLAFLSNTQPGVSIVFDKQYDNFIRLLSFIEELFWHVPPVMVFLLLFYVAPAGLLWPRFRRRCLAWLTQPEKYLLLFTFLSAGSTLSALFLIGDTDLELRYLIPIFFLPPLAAILVMVRLCGTHAVALCNWLALAGILVLLADAGVLLSRNGIATTYYPERMACLDRVMQAEGLRRGIAGYWEAKPIHYFTRTRPQMAPYAVTDDGTLVRRIWHLSRKGYYPSYDFAVLTPDVRNDHALSRAAVERHAGKAGKEVRCGEYLLLVYGRGQAVFP